MNGRKERRKPSSGNERRKGNDNIRGERRTKICGAEMNKIMSEIYLVERV